MITPIVLVILHITRMKTDSKLMTIVMGTHIGAQMNLEEHMIQSTQVIKKEIAMNKEPPTTVIITKGIHTGIIIMADMVWITYIRAITNTMATIIISEIQLMR